MNTNIWEQLDNLSPEEIEELKKALNYRDTKDIFKPKRKQKRKSPEFDIKEHRAKRTKGRKGAASRIQKVDVDQERENLFFTKGWNRLHRDIYKYDEDAKRDKEISRLLKEGKLEITPRHEPRVISVQCAGCNREFEVSPQMVQREDGKYRYKCNNCILSRGKDAK